jgi:serine/threonine protein kinase/Tfp pilus assembly protein PilF
MLSVGDTIWKYEILEFINQGGMGAVYKARDNNLDRLVALKHISKEISSKPEIRKMIQNEARISAKIDSEYVVKIWDLFESDDNLFIAYEYIDGISLTDSIGKASLKQKINIALQAAKGLNSAHKLGIIHRDIKPENMIVSRAARIKILDFGLARVYDPNAAAVSEDVVGTIHYMSPEQISGDEQNFSSDIFSLGTVFYELFAGQRPFEGRFKSNIIYSILHEDPTSLREFNPDIPAWLDFLILRMLDKTPSSRFQSLDEVIKILENPEAISPETFEIQKAKSRSKTITVMNFNNLSGDLSWSYFCKGFTQDLIKEISARTNLIVASEPEGFQESEISKIIKRCRSDYAMTGSLLKWKKSVRLFLNIYSGESAEIVFAKKYEDNLSEFFTLLDKVSQDAAHALSGEDVPKPAEKRKNSVIDVGAYDYYLKGINYYKTNVPANLEFAEGMFTKALKIDPDFALAHVGISDVHTFQYMAYYDRSSDRIENAREAVEKALLLDPELPEAYRSLGRYHMFTGGYSEAQKALLKCVELSPKYALGYRTLAWLKDMQGENDKAIEWAKQSLELAPTDLETMLLLGILYYQARKYTSAIATLSRAIELGPDYGRAYYLLGIVFMKLGILERALQNFEHAIKFKGDPNCCNNAAYVCLAMGDTESAVKQFNNAIREDYMVFCSYYYLGLIEKLKGNYDSAENYFRLSCEAVEEFEKEQTATDFMLSYKAMAFAGLDKKDQALTIVDTFRKKNINDGKILWNMARCMRLLGKYELSDEYTSRAMQDYNGPTEKELQFDPHFTHFEAAGQQP